MTREQLNPRLVELVPPLTALAPPAIVVDKRHYSPFPEPAFKRAVNDRATDCLVITGAETDVCVLACVMDAVDAGYRVVLAEDALCSASDESHDALLKHFSARFSQQIEVASTDEILATFRRKIHSRPKRQRRDSTRFSSRGGLPTGRS
jgi:nicotinamidase-related amidase